MVKKITLPENSVFVTKTAEQRSQHVKDNPGVMLSGVCFNMLKAIYLKECKDDSNFALYNKIYAKRKSK